MTNKKVTKYSKWWKVKHKDKDKDKGKENK